MEMSSEEAALVAKYSKIKVKEEITALKTAVAKEIPRSSSTRSWDSFQDESASNNTMCSTPTKQETASTVPSSNSSCGSSTHHLNNSLPPLHPNSRSFKTIIRQDESFHVLIKNKKKNGHEDFNDDDDDDEEEVDWIKEACSNVDDQGESYTQSKSKNNGRIQGEARRNDNWGFQGKSSADQVYGKDEDEYDYDRNQQQLDISDSSLPNLSEISAYLKELASQNQEEKRDDSICGDSNNGGQYIPVWISHLKTNSIEESSIYYNYYLSGTIISENALVEVNAHAIFFTIEDCLGDSIQVWIYNYNQRKDDGSRIGSRFGMNRLWRGNSTNNLTLPLRKSSSDIKKIKQLANQFYKGRTISILCPIMQKNENSSFISVHNVEDVIDLVSSHHLPTSARFNENISKETVNQWRMLGDDFFHFQTFKPAMECYERAITTPTSASCSSTPFLQALSSLFSSRAYAYLKLNQYALALLDATVAHRINPNNYKAPYRIILALLKLVENKNNNMKSNDDSCVLLQSAEYLRLYSIQIFPAQFTHPYITLGCLSPNTFFKQKLFHNHDIIYSWIQKAYFSEAIKEKEEYERLLIDNNQHTLDHNDPVMSIWQSYQKFGNRSCSKGHCPLAVEQYTYSIYYFLQNHLNGEFSSTFSHSSSSILNLLCKRAEAAIRNESYREALVDSIIAIALDYHFYKAWAFKLLALKGIEQEQKFDIRQNNYFSKHYSTI